MAHESQLQPEVFISYKSEDRERALNVRSALEKNGVSTWMDVSGIRGGEYYASLIVPAIRRSKVFLLIGTQRALESPNIVEEVESAHQFGVPLIPLRIDNYEIPDTLLLHLAHRQRIDLLERSIEEWLPEVLAALKQNNVQIQRASAKRIFGSLPYGLVDCFTGRTDELNRLRQKLGEPMVRFVLVSGPRDVGKTSLVTNLIKSDPGPDTVIYLAIKGSPTLDSLAALLREALPPQLSAQWLAKWTEPCPISDKFEFLFRRLITSRTWIVLDDLEETLSGNGAIAPDWMACIESCLATEHDARIIGLSSEEPKFSPAFEAAFRMRRVRLPVDTGLDDASGMALLKTLEGDDVLGIGGASDEFLGSIVRRCGGLPGSLKMLIGYLISERTQTLREFAADDEEFARFLNHPVLAVYDNLTSAEREVVRALAIYDSPTSKEAIRFLLNRPFSRELDILDRRYVLYGRSPSLQLYPRYQRYAYEQIATEDGLALHRKAAEWFARQCKTKEEIESLADVEAYASRCHHLMRAEQGTEAEEVLYEVDEVMMQRGFAARVAIIRAQLLDLLQEPRRRGRNLRCEGLALSAQGEHQKALDRYTTSFDIGAATGDVKMQSAALISMGWANNELGFHERAHEQLTRAREVIPEADRASRASGALIGNLGDAALNLGHIDEGIELTRQALGLHAGYPADKVVWLGNLGVAHHYLGQFGAAIKYFEEALAIEEHCHFAQRKRVELCRMGRAYLDYGNLVTSIRHYGEANRLATEVGDKPAQSRAVFGLGTVFHTRGEYDAARESYERALAISSEKTRHHCLNKLGILCLQEARRADAHAYFERAIDACNRLIERGNAFDPLFQLALAQLGNASAAALSALRRAVQQCSANGVISLIVRELRILEETVGSEDVRSAIALLEQTN